MSMKMKDRKRRPTGKTMPMESAGKVIAVMFWSHISNAYRPLQLTSFWSR